MKESKDQFYFEGKCFDIQEEFWKYVNEWKYFTLDEETADIHLNNLKKEIMMNIFLRGVSLKNGEFREYINKIFEFSMIELNNICQEKE